jgi:hypothetical protein
VRGLFVTASDTARGRELLPKNRRDAMTPEPLPGYVWLDSKPRRLHVWAAHLEFRNDPEESSA